MSNSKKQYRYRIGEFITDSSDGKNYKLTFTEKSNTFPTITYLDKEIPYSPYYKNSSSEYIVEGYYQTEDKKAKRTLFAGLIPVPTHPDCWISNWDVNKDILCFHREDETTLKMFHFPNFKKYDSKKLIEFGIEFFDNYFKG